MFTESPIRVSLCVTPSPGRGNALLSHQTKLNSSPIFDHVVNDWARGSVKGVERLVTEGEAGGYFVSSVLI